jgi:hypothetical protein
MKSTNFAIIKKGNHYSGFSLPQITFGDQTIIHRLIFTDSCRYNLNNEDQLDVNKLFGIGYLPSHHQKSCRFGWRYNVEKDQMEILAYWYDGGKRYFEHLCWVNIGEAATYLVKSTKDRHYLIAKTSSGTFTKILDFGHSLIGYKLKPFFGGNQKAPQDILILEENER